MRKKEGEPDRQIDRQSDRETKTKRGRGDMELERIEIR